VDQTSADMQTETQKPQHQKNNENGPKHVSLLMRPGSSVLQRMVRPVQDCAVTILPMTSGKTLLRGKTVFIGILAFLKTAGERPRFLVGGFCCVLCGS
jgi:hypothetical protein